LKRKDWIDLYKQFYDVIDSWGSELAKASRVGAANWLSCRNTVTHHHQEYAYRLALAYQTDALHSHVFDDDIVSYGLLWA